MKNIGRIVLCIIYILNLLINSAYCIYDYLGKKQIDKLDFSLLLLFQILSFVIFAELFHRKEKTLKKVN